MEVILTGIFDDDKKKLCSTHSTKYKEPQTQCKKRDELLVLEWKRSKWLVYIVSSNLEVSIFIRLLDLHNEMTRHVH